MVSIDLKTRFPDPTCVNPLCFLFAVKFQHLALIEFRCSWQLCRSARRLHLSALALSTSLCQSPHLFPGPKAHHGRPGATVCNSTPPLPPLPQPLKSLTVAREPSLLNQAFPRTIITSKQNMLCSVRSIFTSPSREPAFAASVSKEHLSVPCVCVQGLKRQRLARSSVILQVA